MNPRSPPTGDAYFASVITVLCRAIAASPAGRRLAGPLHRLIFVRMLRIGQRFAALAARVAVGRLPAPPRPRAPRPPGAAQAAAARPCDGLPHGRGWLMRLVPEERGGRAQLQYLVQRLELAAYLAVAPQAGRILRPLRRMLDIPLPAVLTLPRRPTPPSPVPETLPEMAPETEAARPQAAGGDPPAPSPPPRPAGCPFPAAPAPRRRFTPRVCGPPFLPGRWAREYNCGGIVPY